MMKKKIRVLVVDDEPNIAKTVKDRLEFAGYSVTTASDGEEALQKAKEGPDLILLDIIIPRIHGFEVCKSLKNDSKTKDIPIIVFSATGFKDLVKKEPELHVFDYIDKPIDTKDMLEKINKALSSKDG